MGIFGFFKNPNHSGLSNEDSENLNFTDYPIQYCELIKFNYKFIVLNLKYNLIKLVYFAINIKSLLVTYNKKPG